MKISAGNLSSKNMNNERPILAIESSESFCGVGVYFSDDKYFHTVLKDKHSHSELIMDSVDYVLRSSGVQLNDLSAIAVSSGPGSFTGLRIGMSAAKGLAFGSGLSIIPVPTFEAMAMQISEFLNEGDKFIIANRVNSDEMYYAKFQVNLNKAIFVENLKILKSKYLEMNDFEPIFGNVISNYDYEKRKFRNVTAPDSVYIAKWAKQYGEKLKTKNFDYLEPNYLKNFIVKVKNNA